MARPTTDFAKEGLFNILNNRLSFDDIHVLDLFAGTGSIGFECLSRGVLSVTSLERLPLHVKFIRSVIQKLNANNMSVIETDVYTWIERARTSYDLIFADAPYSDERLSSIPDKVFASNLLKEGGILVMEHSKKTNFTDHPRFTDMRHYGSVHFSFFE